MTHAAPKSDHAHAEASERSISRSLLSALALIGVSALLWQWWVKPTLAGAAGEAQVPTQPVPIADLQTRGSMNARVGLVVFSDYQCPFCKTFAEQVVPDIVSRYVDSGRVLLGFGDLPLESIHPAAVRRAAIANCGGRQGHFWDVHMRLFSLQTVPAAEQRAAERLDANALADCLAADADELVRRHAARAMHLGIRSTPTVLIGYVDAGLLHATDALGGLTSTRQLSEVLDRRLDPVR